MQCITDTVGKLIQEKAQLTEQLMRSENNNQAYLHKISVLTEANQAAGDLLRDAQEEIKALKIALEARKAEGSTSHQDSGENASRVHHGLPEDALERFRVIFEAEEGQNLWDPSSRRYRKYEKRLTRAWFWWQKRDLVMGCEKRMEEYVGDFPKPTPTIYFGGKCIACGEEHNNGLPCPKFIPKC